MLEVKQRIEVTVRKLFLFSPVCSALCFGLGLLLQATNRIEEFLFHSLFLLLLLQRSPLLHQVTVKTRLLPLLLLQVDASDEASSVQLYLMLFFVTGKHIGNITLFRLVHILTKQRPASITCSKRTMCSCCLTLGCSQLKCLQKHPTQTQTSCRSGGEFSCVF